MDSRSISFVSWCRNHADDHGAKWCRELYPWEVFAAADYGDELAGADQRIRFGGVNYVIRLLRRWAGNNGRVNYLAHLMIDLPSRKASWEARHWDDTFHLVGSPEGQFITLYTERDDPSKKLLKDFMLARFDRVSLVRSKPLSAMLFRSLISYAAEEAFGPLSRYQQFEPEGFAPFLSKGRELWVSYSFTEEKAHRLALQIAPKCDRLIVVYCHPTLSKHHRCRVNEAKVVSLPEFLDMISPDVRNRFMPQARFLINHLVYDKATVSSASVDELKEQILVAQGRRQTIPTSALREAKVGLGLCVETVGDCAYFFACANLMNAAMNEKLGVYEGSQKLRKEVYSFKAIVSKMVERLTREAIPGVSCYFDADGVTYLDILGVQFSFHAIARTHRIAEYMSSHRNVPQRWAGIRLQPVAPLVLEWASALVRDERRKPKSASGDRQRGR